MKQINLICNKANAGKAYIKVKTVQPHIAGQYTNATGDGLAASQPITFTAPGTSLFDIGDFALDTDDAADGVSGYVVY